MLRIGCLLICMMVSGPAAAQNISDYGASVQSVLNATRAQAGRGGVTASPILTQAAAAHLQDMVANGFFSHTGSDRSSVGKRVRRLGYGYCFVAENIAKGQRDVAQVMRSWMSSRGHRRNILSRRVTQFGLVKGPGNLWVMVLARPGC